MLVAGRAPAAFQLPAVPAAVDNVPDGSEPNGDGIDVHGGGSGDPNGGIVAPLACGCVAPRGSSVDPFVPEDNSGKSAVGSGPINAAKSNPGKPGIPSDFAGAALTCPGASSPVKAFGKGAALDPNGDDASGNAIPS